MNNPHWLARTNRWTTAAAGAATSLGAAAADLAASTTASIDAASHTAPGIPLGLPEGLAAMLWLPVLLLTLGCALCLLVLILRDSAQVARGAWLRRLLRRVSEPRIHRAIPGPQGQS